MKHNWTMTLILLGMFIITQFVGLYVISQYSPIHQTVYNPQTGQTTNITINQSLPYGFQPPTPQSPADFWWYFLNIGVSFVIAITLIFILTKYRWKFFIKGWFFIVIIIALSLALNAFIKNYFTLAWLLALIVAIPLAFIKVYRPHYIVHNLTELFVYPGIAAVFVPILNWYTVMIFLILISIYDIWAVWHSGIMQKMAKFQMNELQVFGGFFIPYLTKEVRDKIKKIKLSKTKNAKNKKIKVSLAILGGGDVVFPIITAGVFMVAYGLIPALFVILGAFAGLFYLLAVSEKKKFYPAMPFITSGIFIALLIWKIIFLF